LLWHWWRETVSLTFSCPAPASSNVYLDNIYSKSTRAREIVGQLVRSLLKKESEEGEVGGRQGTVLADNIYAKAEPDHSGRVEPWLRQMSLEYTYEEAIEFPFPRMKRRRREFA
jgi:hypothetical protein